MATKWFWTITSVYTTATDPQPLGPFDTEAEVEADKARVRKAANKLQDGVRRYYGPAFEMEVDDGGQL